ncbi:glucose-6-phosphate isomerase [Nocardia blacklockiae]|uniref:glucose-6-phosphate isomerase n=1 Tax=Nocardia blacklockiae TaxID=480036 RepID=UPI00189474BF|nr:glucose-6-phosphate isomerase [Nocardia blacklockiae]MBF6170088.1 glucose-6-phosphate isomerase [Nocardia blacklockiae]
MTKRSYSRWEKYCTFLFADPSSGISVDVSGADFPISYPEAMAKPMARAFAAMAALEHGDIANADEGRRVGHYWLRAPARAPDRRTAAALENSWALLGGFADRVRTGELSGVGGRFRNLIHVGIGGSATGVQMLCDAWRHRSDDVCVQVLDNADPDGVDRVIGNLVGGLGQTLVSVVSKSGITPTPWHVMLALERAYSDAGATFAAHAVATTMAGSDLAERAFANRWLQTFPLWEWVGGRYSVTSMVGLLPAALLGVRTEEFLAGAARMDECTRVTAIEKNPAALLALTWFWLGGGIGERNMVVLPYRDELVGLTRWIQQLVMESVGKRVDRTGRIVHQGLTVYGHKGVSDQHSYLQQLREGRDDSFVMFIGTHRARGACPRGIDPSDTLDGHLFGGLLGTMRALSERGRPSIVIMLPDSDEHSLGGLVALFERAVGLYAELIDVNAYDQPGVDKHVAVKILELQKDALACLARAGGPMTALTVAEKIGVAEHADIVHRLLEHLSIGRPDVIAATPGATPAETVFFTPNECARDDRR